MPKTIRLNSLPPGIRGFRFYSGRPMPVGASFKTTMMGPLVIVEGSVAHGPHVIAPCAIVNGEIILDDALWFENEMKPLKLTTLDFTKVV